MHLIIKEGNRREGMKREGLEGRGERGDKKRGGKGRRILKASAVTNLSVCPCVSCVKGNGILCNVCSSY